MRTRLVVAALVVLAALAAIAMMALRRVDGESARAAVEARLEAALGLPVELGAAELSMLPGPTLRIRDAHIGGTSGLVVDVPELRVGVELVGIFGGRPVIRSIELLAPRVRMSLREAVTEPAPVPATPEAVAAGVHLPVAVRVRDGVLEAGSVRLEGVELSGDLTAAPDGRFEFEADVPGLARMEEGRLTVSDLAEPVQRWRWSASTLLADADLAEAGVRVGLPGIRGDAVGRLAAEGRGAAPDRGSIELETGNLDLEGKRHHVSGRAMLSADLEGSVEIDLGGARIRLGDGFEKGAGTPFRMSGRVAAPALELRDLRIESDALHAEGELDLAKQVLTLRSGRLDLPMLAAWDVPDQVPPEGSVEIESARLAGDPPAFEAAGRLSQVTVSIGSRATASVSGRVSSDGARVFGDDLAVAVGGESVAVSGSYAWADPRIELDIAVTGAQLAPLAGALWGSWPVSGRVYARIEVAGPPDPLALTGSGDFEVQEGELPGLSLARAAGLAPTLTEPEPEGLDRFEQIRASFEIAGDRLVVNDLTVIQEHTMAVLRGPFQLRERAPDFTGAVQFDHPELPQIVVRPILRMAGTIGALETHISDAETDDVQEMEARMIEAIRKVEAERRAARGGARSSGS